MKKLYALIICLGLFSCYKNHKGIIADAINQSLVIDVKENMRIEQSIYENGKSTFDTLHQPSWKKIFAPFYQFNFETYTNQPNDYVIDTIQDLRTGRFLVRAEAINQERNFSSAYLILDSLKNIIQFSATIYKKNWLKNTTTHLFWDKTGNCEIKKQISNKIGSNVDYQWIGNRIK